MDAAAFSLCHLAVSCHHFEEETLSSHRKMLFFFGRRAAITARLWHSHLALVSFPLRKRERAQVLCGEAEMAGWVSGASDGGNNRERKDHKAER